MLSIWYYALNGTNWTDIDTSLWTTDAPICTWAGVGCDTTAIISLEFNSNNSDGTIPSEVRGLQSLLILDVEDNFVWAQVPQELPSTLLGLNV